MNIINKIINLIKSQLTKNKIIKVTSKKIEKQEEKITTTISEDLLEIPKTKEQIINELCENIQFGDIIWAKRYTNDEEKQRIPKGHQEGPFLVLGKCPKGLICSPGLGTTPKEKHINKFVEINQNGYTLTKNTYFKTLNFELLDDLGYIKTLDSLNKNDLSKQKY